MHPLYVPKRSRGVLQKRKLRVNEKKCIVCGHRVTGANIIVRDLEEEDQPDTPHTTKPNCHNATHRHLNDACIVYWSRNSWNYLRFVQCLASICIWRPYDASYLMCSQVWRSWNTNNMFIRKLWIIIVVYIVPCLHNYQIRVNRNYYLLSFFQVRFWTFVKKRQFRK